MTDFSIPIIVAPKVKKQDKCRKKVFVDKLKGKRVKVCRTVTVGVTFTVCNTSTQDVFQVYKVAQNTWMIWGSISYQNLTDSDLEDVLWDICVSSGYGETDMRITDEFGCLTWVL